MMRPHATLGSGVHQLPRDGRFRVLAELGHGGMAVVYLAVALGPRGFNKLVVLKVLRQNLSQDPELLAMFLNEARLAARLNHPNVVQTYEVTENESGNVIVMEYLDGHTLSQLVNRGRKLGRPMPLAHQLRVITDSLAGLDYAHELEDFNGQKLNLVHRDVSPHNVFVTFEGQCKLLDFGIAKSIGSAETKTGIIKGKVRYMAPEQMAGERVDRRADIYAVGVMLWEAATGHVMWKGEQDIAVMHKVLSGQPAPAPRSLDPEISENLERIIVKALAYERDERYATARELEQDLEEELRRMGQVVRARDVGKLAVDYFAEARAEKKALIEAQISRANALTTAEYDAFDPIKLHSAHGKTESDTPAEQDADMSSVSAVAPAPKARRGRVVILAGVVAAAIAGTAAVIALPAKKSPSPAAAPSILDAPAPTADPADVRVEIEMTSTPVDAQLYLDDVRLATNPFVMKISPDAEVHHLRAEAKGYTTHTIEVSFAKSTRITIALEKTRIAPQAAPPQIRQHHAAPPPKPPSATAAPPPPPPAAAPPKPNCSVPFFVDEQGIKRVRPECR